MAGEESVKAGDGGLESLAPAGLFAGAGQFAVRIQRIPSIAFAVQEFADRVSVRVDPISERFRNRGLHEQLSRHERPQSLCHR